MYDSLQHQFISQSRLLHFRRKKKLGKDELIHKNP